MSQTPKAFPINEGHRSTHGMDLRDYFAAKALVGIISHPNGLGGVWDEAASHAYRAADAMLLARSAPPVDPKAVK